MHITDDEVVRSVPAPCLYVMPCLSLLPLWFQRIQLGRGLILDETRALDSGRILFQEASSYLPSVRPERRRELTEDLQSAAPMALQILATCLNTAAKSAVLSLSTMLSSSYPKCS